MKTLFNTVSRLAPKALFPTRIAAPVFTRSFSIDPLDRHIKEEADRCYAEHIADLARAAIAGGGTLTTVDKDTAQQIIIPPTNHNSERDQSVEKTLRTTEFWVRKIGKKETTRFKETLETVVNKRHAEQGDSGPAAVLGR